MEKDRTLMPTASPTLSVVVVPSAIATTWPAPSCPPTRGVLGAAGQSPFLHEYSAVQSRYSLKKVRGSAPGVKVGVCAQNEAICQPSSSRLRFGAYSRHTPVYSTLTKTSPGLSSAGCTTWWCLSTRIGPLHLSKTTATPSLGIWGLLIVTVGDVAAVS